ncbi:MAG TPA: amino acid adenylation domain-containing protein, partial [Thermoanaerobaculia bacterium]|nr:amino acid adenylation domain-containing protein [Thermoanaerobaculia bacterium]
WSWVERGEASPAIGRPVSNTRAYVVDGRGEPLPVGVPGELLLGGAGLARGYLGRPEMTAERFVPDPFGEPGGRLYRTGDLARWRRGDGELEFLGRRDHQVKVRGFRIELGEVESALLEQPGVRQAAVLAHDGALVGYVAAESEVEAAALRQALEERLPGYMVPASWVLLGALPQTANGKVDRKALAEVQPQGGAGDGAGRGPRTPTEEVLAGVWSEVLGLDRVEVESSFFELGGHSLLATRVVSRVRDLFGVELGVRSLFESSTVAALARRIDAALRGVIEAVPPLVPVARDEVLPLSFGQERLWFLDQLEPGSPLYNMPAAVRLRGMLEPRWVEGALAAVVERHEALRTRFAVGAAGPVQVIDSGCEIRLPLVDLTALAAPARQAEAARLAGEEARRPFDLTRGPLVRAALLSETSDEHRLLLTLHHIVADGWSLGVLVRELSAAYEALSRGAEPRLAALPVQYGDFTVWQRQALGRAALEPQVSYWRQRLAGLEPLELPADRPRPAVASWRGASRPAALPPELWRELTALARREGATPFMVLTAGYAALLGRWAGRDDVAVGTPVAGRTRSELEGLVGFFVNTLVLRIDLSGEPTFAGLLGRVRETALGAYAHQDLPFEKLVEELGVARSLGQAPLVQAVLALQDEPLELRLPGLELSALPTGGDMAKFDLTLDLRAAGGGVEGDLEYRTDLFDGPTVGRFAGQLTHLLLAAAGAPGRPLGELSLLSAAEEHQVLREWNETGAATPDAPIHLLFAEQARSMPDRIALSWDAGSLSYGELERWANRLAHHLRRRGVGPEVRVGLCVERSPAMVIGVLGILKAGGAYVPLDPGHPRERLAFLAADTGLPALVTEERLAPSLPAGPELILLDADREAIARQPERAPADGAGAASLAYVMYTSGSTGRPKGVAISHRNVVRLVREASFADLGADQVFLQAAPLAFDASTLEIWAPLLNGGRLALLPAPELSLAELGGVLAEQGVTALWLTAGLFHQMVESHLTDLRPLRQLLAGGDVLSPVHVRRLREELPGCRLINGYGPTEGTTFSCCHPVTETGPLDSVPIGRPIQNAAAYVVDEGLRPLAAGVPGELLVGGEGLARGYL